MKVLSVLSVIGHPRDSKRISMLLENSFQVEAVAFDRGYHNARKPSCKVHVLGKIENGKYLQRIFKMVKAIPVLRRHMKENDVVYASGSDMALFSLVAGVGLKKSIVLEVGDIRKIQVSNGVIGHVMRWLDKKIANNCKLLIVTSSQFIFGYYNDWLKVYPDFLTIENKLEKKIEKENNTLDDTVFRIGYFGVLRCKWTWEILKKTALSMGKERVEITIAGISLLGNDFDSEINQFDNINYLGNYKSPEDLPKLYSDLDVVWACYPSPDVADKNWYWAQLICRSNRFYESCNFAKPIITIKGSGDAIEIEKHQIGLVLDNQESDYIVKKIENISKEDIANWKQNMLTLPQSVFIVDNESSDLHSALKKIHKTQKYFNDK